MVGGIGAALGLLSAGLLERFAGFTLVLAGGLVPIGGILLAHYVVLRRPVHVPDLYDEAGPYAALGGWSSAGVPAWVAGAVVFYLAGDIGATLPSLVAAMAVYIAVTIRTGRRRAPRPTVAVAANPGSPPLNRQVPPSS